MEHDRAMPRGGTDRIMKTMDKKKIKKVVFNFSCVLIEHDRAMPEKEPIVTWKLKECARRARSCNASIRFWSVEGWTHRVQGGETTDSAWRNSRDRRRRIFNSIFSEGGSASSIVYAVGFRDQRSHQIVVPYCIWDVIRTPSSQPSF